MERTRTLRVAGALAFCLVCALALSFHASRPAVDVLSLLPGREFVLARSSRPRLAPFAVFVHGTRRCSWLSESIINTGSVEDDILDELERVVAEHVALHPGVPFHVVDVGANIGFVSLFAASLSPAVHVTAVEATPWHYELMSASLIANPALAARVQLFKLGLGPQDPPYASLCMRAEPGNAAATVAFPGECKGEGGDAAEGTTVPLEMLDAVVARSWRYPPALLKIDVEGFEPLIFDGGRQLLQNRPLTVVGEFIPFRVRRALPDKDPYASFFDFFGPAFSVRLVNSKFFGLNASATTEQTLAEIRGWANAKQHNGGNVVLTAAAASGGGVS